MLLKKTETIQLFQALKYLSNASCSEKGFYAYRKNMRLLAPIYEDIAATQKQMSSSIPQDFFETTKEGVFRIKPSCETEPPVKAYMEENKKFMESTDEIDLHLVDIAELRMTENNIPNGVIDMLFPILMEPKE